MYTKHQSKTLFSILAKFLVIAITLESLFLQTKYLLAEELPEETSEEVINSTPEETVVETGDAVSILELNNEANTNIIENSTEESTTTPQEEAIEEFLGLEDTLTASATNTATIDNFATSTAETGDNTITDATDATIITGDGYAVANVVNLVNTNILNSDGLIQFFTALGLSSLDVRNLFSVFETETSQSTTPCVPGVCGDGGFVNESNTDNTATINNTVIVRASTGENNIEGTGEGSITTGDAYAAANIFNLANTNIVDSNYLLVSINNLGSLDGDIILPNADLLNKLFAGSGVSGGTSANNNNTADIDNNVEVGAETGLNSNEGGDVTTGDASASGNITNQVNQNLIGGDSFLILIRVHGSWSGEIFGLPNNMLWSETPQGITVYNAPAEGEAGADANYTTNNTNQATIQNNVSVFALTGDNKIEGTASGNINTGNAYAAANITNLANLNILSQNWALLIFDIFGDWGGNIAFGRPDLWVGVEATSADNPIMPGSEVKYTYTVSNLGDTTASDVVLNNVFAAPHLNFLDNPGELLADGKKQSSWEIGSIPAGATREVSYIATVGTDLPPSNITTIPLTVSAEATENEDVVDNNSDTIVIEAGVIRRSGGGSNTTKPAEISVSKQVAFPNTTVPATMDYTVTVENSGGPLYNAVLSDILRNEAGELIHEEFWELGTVAADELITVTYTIEYSSSTEPGVYTNSVQVIGNHRKKTPSTNNVYMSLSASVDLNISNLAQPLVLGAFTTCDPYLKSFIRLGQNNDSVEVEKLQTFLAEQLTIELPATGVFDELTEEAVINFQEQYREEILSPWGIAAPTGYVYLTTRKTINELVCQREVAFPLTPFEEQVIAMSKLKL